MTLTSPPYVLQGSSHGAQLFREAISSVLAPAGGIVQPSDFALTQNGTPNMSVNIGAGRCWIPGTSLATVNPGGGAYYPQGSYFAESDAAVNLAISASDPSNPRIDTVICQVHDAAYAGATNSAALAIVTGTPTIGATLANLSGVGAVPGSSLVLGYVLVPANATTIVTADLSAGLGTARPGLNAFLSGLDGSKPAASTVAGAEYYATDSNALYFSDGIAWRTIYGSRGATNIAGPESRTNVAYGLMPTPDQVQNVVLPTNGLIKVSFQAVYTSAGAARAAIFLGANQLLIAEQGSGVQGPVPTAAGLGASAVSSNIVSWAGGLAASMNPSVSNYTGDATTGQVVGGVSVNPLAWELNGTLLNLPESTVGSTAWTPMGGPCYIFAAAGTYTVSVQVKTTSGAVTLSNRKLWVQALPFG